MKDHCAICGREMEFGLYTNGDGYGDAKHVGIVPPEFAGYCWDCVEHRRDQVPNLNSAIDEAFAQAGMCGFLEAWVGRCRNPRGQCARHGNQRCWKCGEPATRNCAETSSLVCGIPECSKHPHEHPARVTA